MLTLNSIIENKYPVGYVLNAEDKIALLNENKDNNYSYYCLLKEMLTYETTVNDLLRGWGGVNLFTIK